MRPLPPIVTTHNKYRWGLAAFFFFVALYVATNSMHWRELNVLVPGPVDNAVPLLPVTVWVYSSYVLISLTAYIIENDRIALSRFVYAQLAANVLSAIVFVVWPTTFLRPQLPETGGISAALLHFVWILDEPVNCFPSLHVSSSLIAALTMWRRGGRVRPVFAVWALAIALSTMTTKQHHFFDVLGGTLLAAVLYWFFFALAKVRKANSEVAIQA